MQATLHDREDATMTPTSMPKVPEAANSDECRLMAELSIIRGRRHFFYDGYQYDRLADAVAYARVVRGRVRLSGPSSPPAATQ